MAHNEPDAEHQPPPNADDFVIEAVGKLTEALETTERARGHLYSFHQLTGKADFEVGDAVELLRRRGVAGDLVLAFLFYVGSRLGSS